MCNIAPRYLKCNPIYYYLYFYLHRYPCYPYEWDSSCSLSILSPLSRITTCYFITTQHKKTRNSNEDGAGASCICCCSSSRTLCSRPNHQVRTSQLVPCWRSLCSCRPRAHSVYVERPHEEQAIIIRCAYTFYRLGQRKKI